MKQKFRALGSRSSNSSDRTYSGIIREMVDLEAIAVCCGDELNLCGTKRIVYQIYGFHDGVQLGYDHMPFE